MLNTKRYLVSISYDGSAFDGFQRLNNKKTVQKEIEKTLKKIAKKEIAIKGSGRTDKGVHAISQKCHFDLGVDIPIDKLLYALNNNVDKYIHFNDIKEVSNIFHARFDVVSKTYLYKINYKERNPLKENYYYQYKYDFDIRLIKKASEVLIGYHDFRNFVCGYRKDYHTTINYIEVRKTEDSIEIEINGTAFYQYMIRNIVGILLLIGKKEKTIDYLEEMLNNPTKKYYCPTLPSNGLYLIDVFYTK